MWRRYRYSLHPHPARLAKIRTDGQCPRQLRAKIPEELKIVQGRPAGIFRCFPARRCHASPSTRRFRRLPLAAAKQTGTGIKATANSGGVHAGDGEHRRSVNSYRRERQRSRCGQLRNRCIPCAKRDQCRHQHQADAVRGGHHDGLERQPGVPCRRARHLGCAARQVNHCEGGKQAAREDLQREAIHRQAEHHRAGHQCDRCGVPGRNRHQGPQCLRPVACAQAPGGGLASSR